MSTATLTEGDITLEPFSLNIMNETGHIQQIWDPANPDEVANAREQFEKWRKKGYVAYRVQQGGDAGEIMREFDPQARAIIMRPPVVGG